MKRTRPVYGLSFPKVGVGSRRSVQGVGQRYRNTWAEVRNGDYALMWILWWRFRKAYAVPGGWGGTDRLGALYEWRVIQAPWPEGRQLPHIC